MVLLHPGIHKRADEINGTVWTANTSGQSGNRVDDGEQYGLSVIAWCIFCQVPSINGTNLNLFAALRRVHAVDAGLCFSPPLKRQHEMRDKRTSEPNVYGRLRTCRKCVSSLTATLYSKTGILRAYLRVIKYITAGSQVAMSFST